MPGLEGAGRVVRAGSDVDPRADRASANAVRVFGGGLGATRSGTWAEYVAVTARAVDPRAGDARACARRRVRLGRRDRLGGRARPRRAPAGGATRRDGRHRRGRLSRRSSSPRATRAEARRAGRARPTGPAALPAGVEAATPGDRVEPVDLLVDTVGGPLLPERLRSVRPGGRAVLVGYTAGTELRLSLPRLLATDVALLPLNMMRRRLPKGVEGGLVERRRGRPPPHRRGDRPTRRRRRRDRDP